jgi:hypothetical protein
MIPLGLLLLLALQINPLDAVQLRALGKSKPTPKAKPSPTPYSLPADDVDPASRAIRLNQRARNWLTRKYSDADAFLDITGLTLLVVLSLPSFRTRQ